MVKNHILMIGDTAGLIHPLCGNGMAMAIHSAKIASELSMDFLNNKISRTVFEKNYEKTWNYNFKNRLATGRRLSKIFQNTYLSAFVMQIVMLFPFILTKIIKHTHGKPII
jgi:flavin-dependent dehydrogenase